MSLVSVTGAPSIVINSCNAWCASGESRNDLRAPPACRSSRSDRAARSTADAGEGSLGRDIARYMRTDGVEIFLSGIHCWIVVRNFRLKYIARKPPTWRNETEKKPGHCPGLSFVANSASFLGHSHFHFTFLSFLIASRFIESCCVLVGIEFEQFFQFRRPRS